ncbi:hypothetical protein AAFX24_28195 [Vibrio mediterranei]|uniref:hypothetical protein n=1 Tax=Vibrio mediterranei TaxID=689 RepID=UPI0038CE2E76
MYFTILPQSEAPQELCIAFNAKDEERCLKLVNKQLTFNLLDWFIYSSSTYCSMPRVAESLIRAVWHDNVIMVTDDVREQVPSLLFEHFEPEHFAHLMSELMNESQLFSYLRYLVNREQVNPLLALLLHLDDSFAWPPEGTQLLESAYKQLPLSYKVTSILESKGLRVGDSFAGPVHWYTQLPETHDFKEITRDIAKVLELCHSNETRISRDLPIFQHEHHYIMASAHAILHYIDPLSGHDISKETLTSLLDDDIIKQVAFENEGTVSVQLGTTLEVSMDVALKDGGFYVVRKKESDGSVEYVRISFCDDITDESLESFLPVESVPFESGE